MRKIAVIFESSPFDRKGLFNAVHNRTKHLSASGEFEVDAFCMHIKDSLLSRKLRKTPKVPKVESVEVDGISYKMMWRGFSYVDELRRRMSSAPKKLLTYAARQARLFKDYDILVAHSYEAGLVAYEAHRLFGMPYTVTWHGSDVHTHPIKDEARRTLTARIMEKAAVNFFVSANLMETSEKITENAVKSVLYNGVSEGYEKFDDETRAAYRANYGLEPDDKVVAYVGNLHPVKNVEILPELFSRIHDNFEMHLRDCPENQANLKFWVVGDGKLRSQLEPVAKKTAGAQVYFWGNVETGRMSAMMHCIDLLLLQIHHKIVFHSFPPRFTRNWAQRPVNRPVTMLMAIITGKYTARAGVAVMAMAMAICPMEWATAPIQPATHNCFLLRIFRSSMVIKMAHSPPAPL